MNATAAFRSPRLRLPYTEKGSLLRGGYPFATLAAMAAELDQPTYDALPVARSSVPLSIAGIERAVGIVGGPVVLLSSDKAWLRVPPSLESVAITAHAAVVDGAQLPSRPGRLDRILEKLASAVEEDAKPVDALIEHIADRLDQNGSSSGILAMVADEIATRMKTSDLVATLATEFEAEVVKRLPRVLFERAVNPRGAKRRRTSSDQTRLA